MIGSSHLAYVPAAANREVRFCRLKTENSRLRVETIEHTHSVRELDMQDSGLVCSAAWDGQTLLSQWVETDNKPSFRSRSTRIPSLGSIDVVRFDRNAERVAVLFENGLLSVWDFEQFPKIDSQNEQDEKTWGSPLIRSVIQLDGAQTLIDAQGSKGLTIGTNFRFARLKSPVLLDPSQGSSTPLPELPEGKSVLGGALSRSGTKLALLFANQSVTERRRPNLNRLNGFLALYDHATGSNIGEKLEFPSEPRSTVFSDDESTVIVLCADGSLYFVDVNQVRIQKQLQVAEDYQTNSAWFGNGLIKLDPSGRFAVVAGGEKVFVVDVAQQELCEFQIEHRKPTRALEFSDANGLLVTASYDGTANIVNLENKQVINSLDHIDYLLNAKFDASGKRLVTACRDRFARIWDWQNGQLLCAPMEHDDEVIDAVFMNETVVVTACKDYTVQVWESTTGLPLTQKIPLAGLPYRIAKMDESTVVVSGSSDQVAILDLSHFTQANQLDDARIDPLLQKCQLSAAGEVVSNGQIQLFSPAEWFKLWKELDHQD